MTNTTQTREEHEKEMDKLEMIMKFACAGMAIVGLATGRISGCSSAASFREKNPPIVYEVDVNRDGSKEIVIQQKYYDGDINNYHFFTRQEDGSLKYEKPDSEQISELQRNLEIRK